MDLWLSPRDARVRAIRERGRLEYGVGDTPFGPCVGLSSGTHLLALRFTDNPLAELSGIASEWPGAAMRRTATAEALIARSLTMPEEVPVLAVGTPFRLAVWKFLRHGEFGATLTYGTLARAVGNPGAARAVGRAVAANGLALLIPCHRVVSRGGLRGYRWGLARKSALLAWELSRHDPLRIPF